MQRIFKNYLSYLITALLASFITAGIFFAISPCRNNVTGENLTNQPNIKINKYVNELPGTNSFIIARQEAAPSVVYIDTIAMVTEAPNIPEEFRDFFPPGIFGGDQQQVCGAGSGFIIRSNGYILTNEL